MPEVCHTAVSLLNDQARNFGATVTETEWNKLHVTIAVRLSDGRRVNYDLEIEFDGVAISVREPTPRKLPAYCPERHINADGTFCMYWDLADPIKIDNVQSVERWWGTLVQFLRLQERAAKQRRWPSDSAWAHGDAARYQYYAEKSAGTLSAVLQDDVKKSRLRVVRIHRGTCQNGPVLRMYRDNELLYSMWERNNQVIRLRQPCPCGKRNKRGRFNTLRSCENHTQMTAQLVLAIYKMQIAEAEYWDAMQERDCCGCMLSCPLKNERIDAQVDQ